MLIRGVSEHRLRLRWVRSCNLAIAYCWVRFSTFAWGFRLRVSALGQRSQTGEGFFVKRPFSFGLLGSGGLEACDLLVSVVIRNRGCVRFLLRLWEVKM